MSLENIINYTMKTPANTNPAVMSSVIDSSFKQTKEEILNEAKAYSDSKGGYTEPAKVFTHDGNCNTDKQYGDMFKLSDEIIDLTKLIKFTMVMSGQTITMTKDEFIAAGGGVTADVIGNFSEGSYLFRTRADGNDWGVPAGTYTVCAEGLYVSYVAFDGDVHTIDPKYLPGVYLPIIELTTNVTEVGVELTAEETAAISEVLSTSDYCLVKFNHEAFVYPRTILAAKTEIDDMVGMAGMVMANTLFVTVMDGVGMAVYGVV